MGLVPSVQRAFAVDVVKRLRAAGYVALWAGGCVRDDVLGREPKDYDVATSARPPEIQDVFGRRRTLAIGAAFGVITVLGPEGAGQIEVATFRQDQAYSDGRHPDGVVFSSPELDAQRRDFTINGMFFDPIENRLIDYVGGQPDLQARMIRAIGVAEERFTEDKLRMLRAVRFAATFDFALEPATAAAIGQMASEVTVVSPERIAGEMRLMLTSPRRPEAARLLAETGLLAVILPEVAELRAHAEPWSLLMETLCAMGPAPFVVALAAMIVEVIRQRPHGETAQSSAAVVNDIADRWRLSNKEREQTAWLVAQAPRMCRLLDEAWPQRQRLLIHSDIDLLLTLAAARATAAGEPLTTVEYCRAQLARPANELNPAPLLTGDDLVRHGVPRGKIYVHLLDSVRDAQLDGLIADKAAALDLVDRLTRSARA